MSLSDTTKTFDSDQENSAQNPIVSTTNMSPTATADAAPVILKRPVELSPSSEEPIVVNDDLSTPFDGSVKSASPTPSEGSNAEEVVTADNEWGLDSILLTAVQSSKDRLFVLRTEKECADFIHDESQTTLEFPHMNSYQRLLTHRIAVHFKLEHVSDASRRGVVLYKGSGTAIPELNLSDIPVNDAVVAPTQTASFKIMKRHHNHHGRSSRHSSTDSGSENGIGGGPKTLEEREAAYQAARARIFQDDAGSDASSNSRTSGQSTSASTGKSAMRNGKGTGRNQNARPRHTNQAGMGRHRMPHGLTHGGVPSALTQIPMGDVSRGTTYYPYEPTGRNQHMASNTAPPYRGGAPPYVPQYPGLNQGVPSSNYNAPYGVPQHQNYTQANPYADWNPSTYPGYSGVPMGNSGSRTGREPRRPDAYLPGMGAPGVGYNADLGTSGNLSYHQFTAPPLQNPRLHAPFSSQYPALKSDGVALHYLPNRSPYETTGTIPPPGSRQQDAARSGGGQPALDAPFAGDTNYHPWEAPVGREGSHFGPDSLDQASVNPYGGTSGWPSAIRDSSVKGSYRPPITSTQQSALPGDYGVSPYQQNHQQQQHQQTPHYFPDDYSQFPPPSLGPHAQPSTLAYPPLYSQTAAIGFEPPSRQSQQINSSPWGTSSNGNARWMPNPASSIGVVGTTAATSSPSSALGSGRNGTQVTQLRSSRQPFANETASGPGDVGAHGATVGGPGVGSSDGDVDQLLARGLHSLSLSSQADGAGSNP